MGTIAIHVNDQIQVVHWIVWSTSELQPLDGSAQHLLHVHLHLSLLSILNHFANVPFPVLDYVNYVFFKQTEAFITIMKFRVASRFRGMTNFINLLGAFSSSNPLKEYGYSVSKLGGGCHVNKAWERR